MNSIHQAETQLWALDSLLETETDSIEIISLEQAMAEQELLLNSELMAQETALDEFKAQRATAISELLEQLILIAPTNICETNLRRAYEIYLLSVASDLEADSSQLSELETIAMQCPLEGGPGVSIAGLLYRGLTGILPAQGTCNGTGERGIQKGSKSHFSLSLYPNPNLGNFVANIPERLAEQNTLLRILNAQGTLIKEIAVLGQREVAFNLIDQHNGLYFLSVIGNDMAIEVLPFIIQH